MVSESEFTELKNLQNRGLPCRFFSFIYSYYLLFVIFFKKMPHFIQPPLDFHSWRLIY